MPIFNIKVAELVLYNNQVIILSANLEQGRHYHKYIHVEKNSAPHSLHKPVATL